MEKMTSIGLLTDEELEDAVMAAGDIYRAALDASLDEVMRLYREIIDLESAYALAKSRGEASRWFYAIQRYAKATDLAFIQTLVGVTPLDDDFDQINVDFKKWNNL